MATHHYEQIQVAHPRSNRPLLLQTLTHTLEEAVVRFLERSNVLEQLLNALSAAMRQLHFGALNDRCHEVLIMCYNVQ